MESLLATLPSHLREVPVDELRPGMYVADLGRGWLSHMFLRRRFLLQDAGDIERLRGEGIREVVIDLNRGAQPLVPAVEVLAAQAHERFTGLDLRLREAAEARRARARETVSLEEERWRARRLGAEAGEVVRGLMEDVRLGRNADFLRTEEVVDRFMDSVGRHPDALVPLLRLKGHDAYGDQHALSVTAMVVALGNTLDMEVDTIRQAAQGALLQDMGKACIPERILTKPGRLNDFEYARMRSHVPESLRLLEDLPWIGDLTLRVVTEHHERVDGSGYPHRLAGDAISLHAQAAALVEAYDALVSDRPFQAGIEPTEALRELFTGAGRQFRADLVPALVRTLGVYPVGSLVRLSNETLAVVTRQNRHKPLQPEVRVMFDLRQRRYIRPYDLDLARRLEVPEIVAAESYARRGIDPRRWTPGT
ncbi:MAG: HD-GYP domain-containing protein [Rhodocyclaceae bacterium]|nr:HD-GYP domain-containing protein [Rhodocyclaceae bacterium]